jgi:hypothetical protein
MVHVPLEISQFHSGLLSCGPGLRPEDTPVYGGQADKRFATTVRPGGRATEPQQWGRGQQPGLPGEDNTSLIIYCWGYFLSTFYIEMETFM